MMLIDKRLKICSPEKLIETNTAQSIGKHLLSGFSSSKWILKPITMRFGNISFKGNNIGTKINQCVIYTSQ